MVDLTTHRRNAKGDVIAINPYSCHIINGVKVFKQPGLFDGYELENGDACNSEGQPLPKAKPAPQAPVVPPASVTKPFSKDA